MLYEWNQKVRFPLAQSLVCRWHFLAMLVLGIYGFPALGRCTLQDYQVSLNTSLLFNGCTLSKDQILALLLTGSTYRRKAKAKTIWLRWDWVPCKKKVHVHWYSVSWWQVSVVFSLILGVVLVRCKWFHMKYLLCEHFQFCSIYTFVDSSVPVAPLCTQLHR